jgi:predicted MPP superfamily phosphohydrolase
MRQEKERPKKKKQTAKARRRDSSITTMRLGRSLFTGGVRLVKKTREGILEFNRYAQSEPESVAQRRRRRPALSRNLTYLIFLLTIFVIMSVAMMVLNNASVTVDKQTVSVVGLPGDLEGYSLLLVSDLHGRSFGTRQASLLRTINGTSYNMILFAGDMVGRSRDPQPFYDLLEGLSANRPAYFIAGDSDPDPVLEEPRDITGTLDQMVLADWVRGAQERGATYLSATTGVTVGRSRLWLSPVSQMSIDIQATLKILKEEVEAETEGTLEGLEMDRNNLPLSSWRLRQLQKLDESIRLMAPEDTHIALSHYPPTKEYIDVTQQLGEAEAEPYTFLPAVDLVLAGHYCGGGWKLPFLGALYVPDTTLDRHGWFPAKDAVDGLRMLGTTQLYTSPGLSVTDKILLPNFRLFNAPTVTLITLTSAITDDLLGG